MNQATPKLHRFERVVEFSLLAVFATLFAYALAAWIGIWPGDRPNEPFGFVCLTAGMVLQPLAALMRERSRAASSAILLTSALLLLLALVIVAS